MIDIKNMIHAHRFCIAPFLLLLMSGFYMYLQPVYEQQHDLLNQEESLMAQLIEKEKMANQAEQLSARFKSVPVGAPPLLEQILERAALNHLRVVSMETKATENSDKDSLFLIKSDFLGDFHGFLSFLNAVYQLEISVSPHQCLVKRQGNMLMITMHYTAFPWMSGMSGMRGVDKKRASVLGPLRDPFQEDLSSLTKNMTLPDDLSHISLEQLRYIGYLSQGNKTGALLLLPDGSVQIIYSGSFVGKERWHVLSIHPRFLVLQAQNQKITKLVKE